MDLSKLERQWDEEDDLVLGEYLLSKQLVV